MSLNLGRVSSTPLQYGLYGYESLNGLAVSGSATWHFL